ncbi:MAG: acyl-CoA dehydrogenase family protein [Actinobacteria bacterium]|nr:acyl-CoA dehydrogenase family protein [Actinomycetota bacterium]
MSPLELLDVSGSIAESDLAMQTAVARFVEERIRPHIGAWFEQGRMPTRELARELGRLGVMGMHLDGYGCQGSTATSYGLACLELEAGDSAIRSLVSVHGSLAMFAIHRFGSAEQKQEWLPSMATGEVLGCFALTEPDFGSDPGGMRARARRDGEDWLLSGAKMWITNGSVSDVAIVWARTEEGIRGFLVPLATAGVSAPDVSGKLSLRASITSELLLDDVRLPATAVLPEASGLGAALACLNEARFGIVFGALGAARDCLHATLSYAQHRTLFDKPLAAYQITQTKLADMALELGKGMLLALHVGRLKDSGDLQPAQVSLGKLNNVREALRIARECRTILAANGVTLDYPVMRHANNLESVLTYEGTSEVHQLIIGQALTGLPAYR